MLTFTVHEAPDPLADRIDRAGGFGVRPRRLLVERGPVHADLAAGLPAVVAAPGLPCGGGSYRPRQTV